MRQGIGWFKRKKRREPQNIERGLLNGEVQIPVPRFVIL